MDGAKERALAEGRLSRRTLLAVGCGAACAQAFGCGPDVTLPAVISAGAASAVPASSLRAVAGAPAAIGRDSNGIFALSLVCTHSGCDISQDGTVSITGIHCECHDSRFDGQGNVLSGPARSALPHLLVTTDASGQLTIHGDQVVAESTRLAV